MEIVTILRELWRRRLLVALVTLVAVAVGWMLAYEPTFPPKSRSYKVAIATARILVDTPQSQVVEVAPKGSETLGSRANVLANLMVDGELKAAIARRAGLRPNQLHADARSAGGPQPTTPPDPKVRAMTTSVVVNSDLAELPIITVQTQAPDTKQAIRLANSAVSGLTDYLDLKATVEKVSDTRRLRVSGLGAAQAHEAARGPGRTVPLAAAIALFLLGCTAILIASAVIRGWRLAVSLEEELGGDGAVLAGLVAPDLFESTPERLESDETAGALG